MANATLGGLPSDPVDAAIEALRRLDKALRSKCAQEGVLQADALARRAKDAPQLIAQAGLAQTIAFMLSKLTSDEKRKAYTEAVKIITGEKPPEAASEAICRDAQGEGGGYPHMAALLLAYASSIAGCSHKSIESLDSNLLGCLKKIKQRGIALERLATSYSEEVKKLATALYSGSKEEAGGGGP